MCQAGAADRDQSPSAGPVNQAELGPVRVCKCDYANIVLIKSN